MPFAGKLEGQIANFLVIQDKRPDRLREPPLSDAAWGMIQKCWAKEPGKRPIMKDVIASLDSRTMTSAVFSESPGERSF